LSAHDSYPNPNYLGINGSTNDAVSNYNSLQVQLNRRLAHGLSYQFNYTWSHFLDDQDSSGWGSREGPQNRQYIQARGNYGNSNFDERHAFKGLVVYQLPFGKGRQFLNHNFIVDELLGGYQVSTTIQLNTGNPFTVFDNTSNTYAEPGNQDRPFANRSGLPLYGSGTRNINEWFNAAAFQPVGNGAFGATGRNSVYGPGIEYVNMSAGKKFDIHENVKLQIRADASNVFNHPSFAQPNGTLSNFTGDGNGSTTRAINGVTVGGRNLQGGIRLEF
jgi:hypothetical protein